MLKPVSIAERLYIEKGCSLGIREDGRGPLDHRNIFLEDNILPHTNGSSRIKISDGTDILCSVKVEIMNLTPESENKGNFEIAIDISPSCNIKLDDRTLNDIGNQISEVIESFMLDSMAIDLKSFVIVNHKYAWNVFVDVLIFQCNGDPIESCSLAIYAALKTTRIPILETLSGEFGIDDDFTISNQLNDTALLIRTPLPIVIAVAKIGREIVLDCSASEISCASSLILYGLDDEGMCYGSTKLLGGSLSVTDYQKSIQLAHVASKSKIQEIDRFRVKLNQSVEGDGRFQDILENRFGYLA